MDFPAPVSPVSRLRPGGERDGHVVDYRVVFEAQFNQHRLSWCDEFGCGVERRIA